MAPQPARRGLVERDRLVQRLLGAPDVPVVVLAAPAGYGKTLLLEDWARRDPRPFHWLARGRSAIARRRWMGELTRLADAADRLAAPAVVVLDGLDGPGADVDSEADGLVRELVDGMPAGVVLVVACRSDADLHLGRLRAQSDVLELGAGDLAMTPGEAAALLDAHGVRLPRAELLSLMTASQGWPAVLALVAGTLAAERELRATAADVATAHPHVVEYVRDELLAPLPADLVDVVRRAAILEDLDPELCAAVFGRPAGAGWLGELERSGLPVGRPQRTSPSLRLHPVVRGVLRADFERAEPDTARALHRRAGAWFATHDELAPALRHAVAGDDLKTAGALLWRGAQRAAWDGRRDDVEPWLDALAPRTVEAHEGLALSGAVLALSRLDLPSAARLLSAARACAAADDEWAAGRLALEAALEHDDVDAMRQRARAAAARSAEHEPLHALASLVDGAGAAMAGDTVTATRILEATARRALAVAPGLAALCQAQLALVALCHGDWERGATLAERARSRAEALGLEDHALLALVVAVAAFSRAHRGRYAEARVDAELAVALAGDRDELPPWYGAQLALALARAQLRLSELTQARRLLDEARRAADRLDGAAGFAGWLADASAHAGGRASGFAPAAPLTPAELRVLACLPSHLSFREIGARLHVSANTVKSQAHAVYRKLDASSRSAAVARAAVLGLLDEPPAASSASGDVPRLAAS